MNNRETDAFVLAQVVVAFRFVTRLFVDTSRGFWPPVRVAHWAVSLRFVWTVGTCQDRRPVPENVTIANLLRHEHENCVWFWLRPHNHNTTVAASEMAGRDDFGHWPYWIEICRQSLIRANVVSFLSRRL